MSGVKRALAHIILCWVSGGDGGDDDDNNTNLRRLIRALSDVVLGTCWVELLSLLCVHLAVAT